MKKLKHLTDEDIVHNTKMYDTYHHKFKMEDGWLPGNKEDNFEYLMRLTDFTGIPISGTSCLDVGSGTGDMSLFLRKRGMKSYVGYEIYKPSFDKAVKKYPNETFLHADFLTSKFRRKFDYTFCSGALTVKLLNANNYDYLRAVVTKMWKLTKIGIAFNILIDEDRDIDPDLFFFSREKVEEICAEVAPDALVVSEKTPGVFQIHVYMYRNVIQMP